MSDQIRVLIAESHIVKVNEAKAIATVKELMAIPGISGKEKQVAEFVAEKLAAAGVPDKCICFDDAHRKTALPGEIGNMLVRLPGTIEGPRLLLSAHLDTVPLCEGCVPVVEGDRIYSANPETGLGADDRAGVAAILVAVDHLLSNNLPHPPLSLAFFVQEEIGLQGSRNLDAAPLGQIDWGVNFDGGSPAKLTIGATSGVRMVIELFGVAAHAGLAPQSGASAITAASLAIAKLHLGGWLGAVQKGDRVGTSNVGVFQAGQATNVITDYALVKAEARSHDPGFRDLMVQTIRDEFAAAAASVSNDSRTPVRAEICANVDYEAFRLPESHPSVVKVSKVVESLGMTPALAISNGGVDANWLYQHGIQAVTVGCGQRNVHTVQETLDIPDFLNACSLAVRLATGESA